MVIRFGCVFVRVMEVFKELLDECLDPLVVQYGEAIRNVEKPKLRDYVYFK